MLEVLARTSYFFLLFSLQPRVERYQSLCALNTSPPRPTDLSTFDSINFLQKLTLSTFGAGGALLVPWRSVFLHFLLNGVSQVKIYFRCVPHPRVDARQSQKSTPQIYKGIAVKSQFPLPLTESMAPTPTSQPCLAAAPAAAPL